MTRVILNSFQDINTQNIRNYLCRHVYIILDTTGNIDYFVHCVKLVQKYKNI